MSSILNKTIKQNFPIFQKKINGKDLIYLDNAATSQKPQQVIDAISNYYQNYNANVHRGVHTLSDESTTLWEKSSTTIAGFLGAYPEELIITRNTTEAINGVAYGWADHNLEAKDVILASLLDHHANIVTWQEVCKRTGAKLEFIELYSDGRLNMDDLETKIKQFSPRLISLPHVSNTLGVVVDIQHVVDLVKIHTKKSNSQTANSDSRKKTRILLDAAQSVPHMPVNFHALDVDFLAFSGHKMLGPMGVGGLLVKKELFTNQKSLKSKFSSPQIATSEMNPWFFGGGMIDSVFKEKTIFNSDISERFVAGTPDVASAVGLAAACDYLSKIGMENVLKHDLDLVNYALEKLSKISSLEIVGPFSDNSLLSDIGSKNNLKTPKRIGSVAFVYKGVHAHDVAQVLSSCGVAVRSGHHCTMPLHNYFDWQATVRASFQVYNSKEDIDILVKALKEVERVFDIQN